jgi:dCMP deaminase
MRLDNHYLDMAGTASHRSKCIALKVGCVLVLNDKIISTGLNGTLRGSPNCCEVFPDGPCPEHHAWSLENEIHAEMNAIIQAERSLTGAWAFTTISPCRNCLKHLLAAGVTRIYYREKYRRLSDYDMEGIVQFCQINGAILFKEGEDPLFN